MDESESISILEEDEMTYEHVKRNPSLSKLPAMNEGLLKWICRPQAEMDYTLDELLGEI